MYITSFWNFRLRHKRTAGWVSLESIQWKQALSFQSFLSLLVTLPVNVSDDTQLLVPDNIWDLFEHFIFIFKTEFEEPNTDTKTIRSLSNASDANKKTSSSSISKPPLETVIESGPIHETEAHQNDYEADEHDGDDGIVTASSLFAKQIDCEFNCFFFFRKSWSWLRNLSILFEKIMLG